MIRIGNAQIWVHDQDAALEFYTTKVGMEIRADVTVPEMDNFRWLTVGPPGQDDFGLVLMPVPGPPMADTATSAQITELTAKGWTGTVFLVTDDCRKSYEELTVRGVDFLQEPEERPYGVDAGFRDPSGNNVRLTEVRDFA